MEHLTELHLSQVPLAYIMQGSAAACMTQANKQFTILKISWKHKFDNHYFPKKNAEPPNGFKFEAFVRLTRGCRVLTSWLTNHKVSCHSNSWFSTYAKLLLKTEKKTFSTGINLILIFVENCL